MSNPGFDRKYNDIICSKTFLIKRFLNWCDKNFFYAQIVLFSNLNALFYQKKLWNAVVFWHWKPLSLNQTVLFITNMCLCRWFMFRCTIHHSASSWVFHQGALLFKDTCSVNLNNMVCLSNKHLSWTWKWHVYSNI